MSLVFKKIKCSNIFTDDFNPLAVNNKIIFPNSEEIAVVYGPNGTGKTSLVNVLNGDKDTEVIFEFDDVEYQSGTGVFHIIADQYNRNIISGETRDFFLGDDIRYEFELSDQVEEDRKNILTSIISLIKSTYGISAANSSLIDLLVKDDLAKLIKDCANNRSKGEQHSTEKLVSVLGSLEQYNIPMHSPEKLTFIKNDYADKLSIIKKVEDLIGVEITPNIHVSEIEENTEAIGILSRFNKNKCIVCDNENINREALLAAKTAHRQATLDSLDKKVKEAIEKTIPLVPEADPFGIKECLLEAIAKGNMKAISCLVEEFSDYKAIYSMSVENEIGDIVNSSELIVHFSEYQRIVAERPDITDEDYLYIQEIISNNMEKPLAVERDDNSRLRIYLSDEEFLGKERKELPLSTGEQNFLSLTFEFLKAKNSACPFVVIDDPISSFDSIYKNKIAYAIVRMLHNKKRIVLTHNTDLLRLLDAQYNRCYKLYLLNNTDGEENGFIFLRNNEQEMIVSLEKLLSAFRNDIPKQVKAPELFLISMIPFMRGYANIVNNKDLFESLTQVMHGYKTEKVDIADAYAQLFGNHSEFLPTNYEVSVADILSKTIDGIHLLDTVKFPLLNKTLRHSFEYLYLRLMVEKSLVKKFGIDTTKHEQLGQIISAAYPEEGDINQVRNRIRLTSKKTLLNEFNHFEGNMSIFQPAIDITDKDLEKERSDIITFISNL